MAGSELVNCLPRRRSGKLVGSPGASGERARPPPPQSPLLRPAPEHLICKQRLESGGVHIGKERAKHRRSMPHRPSRIVGNLPDLCCLVAPPRPPNRPPQLCCRPSRHSPDAVQERDARQEGAATIRGRDGERFRFFRGG
jgi:hypothetical protein